MVPDPFPPLEAAIVQAESWTGYLKANQVALAGTRRETLESIVWTGTLAGEMLPFTWRLTFDNLFLHGKESWTTVKEFEAVRQKVRRLFFTAREAMEFTRKMGEALRSLTNQKPAGMDRLLAAIENARQLEEGVFRDWPLFTTGPSSVQPPASLPVDESLAEVLGITIEEARQRLDDCRRQRNAEPG